MVSSFFNAGRVSSRHRAEWVSIVTSISWHSPLPFQGSDQDKVSGPSLHAQGCVDTSTPAGFLLLKTQSSIAACMRKDS